MSGIESRRLVFVVEQLREAIGQQADDVLGGLNVQCPLWRAARYRQPQLDVVSVGVRWLAEARHRDETFGTVAQPDTTTTATHGELLRDDRRPRLGIV